MASAEPGVQPVERSVLALELRRVLVPRHVRRPADLVRATACRTMASCRPGASSTRARRVNFEINGGPVHTQETRAVRRLPLRHADQLHARVSAGLRASPPPSPVRRPGWRRGPAPRPAAPQPRTRAVGLYPGRLGLRRPTAASPDISGRRQFRALSRDGVPLWQTHTDGTSPGRAVMQLDGNLVVYDGSGTPLWASGTAGYARAYLSVQDDGNVVVYGEGARHCGRVGRTGIEACHSSPRGSPSG